MSTLEELIPSTVRRLQILVGALITGVLVFAAVAVLVVTNRTIQQSASTDSLFLYIVAALAVAGIGAFEVFRRVQAGKLARTGSSASDDELLQAFTTRTIVGAALAEAVAMLSVAGYLVTANALLMAGVVGALLVMTAFLPKEERLRSFLREAGRPA